MVIKHVYIGYTIPTSCATRGVYQTVEWVLCNRFVPQNARITRLVSCQPVCSASKAMDERETECLVELLTQSLFDPGVDEADQLFSQVPLPED